MVACCPFCNLPQERIVAASEHMRAIRDAFPVSPGHTLLLPRRHVGSLFDLTVVEWVELGQLLARVRAALQAEFRPTVSMSGSTRRRRRPDGSAPACASDSALPG